MIEFIEVSSKQSLGTVELKDEKLVAPIQLRSMVQAWLRQDKTPQAFMEFYSSWSNGYMMSSTVEDAAGGKAGKEEVPEKLSARTFAKDDEALTPLGAIEMLREIIIADVDSDPERGYAGVEAKEEMDNYLELITEALSEGTPEDVRDVIENVLEEVPIEDYEGAEHVKEYFEELVNSEGEEEEPASETETLAVQKVRTSVFPKPIKR